MLLDEQKERLRQLTDIVLATAQVREGGRMKFLAYLVKSDSATSALIPSSADALARS